MRRLMVISLLATVGGGALTAGCGGSLKDDRFATGSATVVASSARDAVLNVNVDEGTVSRLDRSTGAIQELAVGGEPTRIARVGKDEYWVTLRADRAIAVISEKDGVLSLKTTLPAGVEPHGIVASENGKRVYVTNSQSDTVVEYDGKSREELRTFAVQDEPKWLALHPNGEVLYVASAKHGTLSWIDLRSGEVSPIQLPHGGRNDVDGGIIDLDPRNTGDLAVTPDGGSLGVPTLYADTETSVDEPIEPTEPVIDGYGANNGSEIDRMNPVLVTVDLDAQGHPTDDVRGILLATTSFTEREAFAFRSYPSSVTASPTANEWVVTMEGSNVTLVLSTSDPSGNNRETVAEPDRATFTTSTGGSTGGEFKEPMPFTSARDAGFDVRSVLAVTTSAGPRGVVFTGDKEAYVHAFIDRAVGELPYDELEDGVDLLNHNEFPSTTLYGVRSSVQVATSALDPDVEAGRRLFYSAVDERMAGAGAGVSCATCHHDGRNDGFTWTLDGEPRQTPSLAGPVDQTAPVTWTNNVSSVAEEATLTSFLRMGGIGLTPSESSQIDAFVNATRYPDVRRGGDNGDLVSLGRQVFADAGCATCHNGALFTDNAAHVVIGAAATQTPTLRGISASAPYFHDGSAPDLRAVVEMARSGAMGDTSALTAGETDALVAYLESL